MLKKLFLAVAASLSFVAPVGATVYEGTGALMSAVHAHPQFTVGVDNKNCDRGYMGSFRPYSGQVTICTGDNGWDANDHDTVRHETWHVIQHCLRHPDHTKLQPLFTPGTEEWDTYVIGNLTHEMYHFILTDYPETHHNIELEAFAMARSLTASQVQDAFERACYD